MIASDLKAIPHQTTLYRLGEATSQETPSSMAFQVSTFTVGAEANVTLPDGFTAGMRRGDFAAMANLVSFRGPVAYVGQERHALPGDSAVGGLALRAIKEFHPIRPRLLGVEVDALMTSWSENRIPRSFESPSFKTLIAAALLDAGLHHFDATMGFRVHEAASAETDANVADPRLVRAENDSTDEIVLGLHSHMRQNGNGTMQKTKIIDHKVVVGYVQQCVRSVLYSSGATVVSRTPLGASHRQLSQYGGVLKSVVGR